MVPVGLRILVVDDDITCLMMLDKMLGNCLYEEGVGLCDLSNDYLSWFRCLQSPYCQQAEFVLSMLRVNKGGFDIVISDIHMPNMNGFELLKCIGLEMDLPVIPLVMKGVKHGACDYLIKPVQVEAIRYIWQHVVRKRRNEVKELDQSSCMEDCDQHQKPSEGADYVCPENEGNWRNLKRRKDEEDEGEERDDTSTLKKRRVVWSVELHQLFATVVNQLGNDSMNLIPMSFALLIHVCCFLFPYYDTWSKGLQVSDGASDLLNSPTSPISSSSAHVDSIYGNQSSYFMMQMAQPRPRGQILNGITGDHASGFPLSIEKPIFANGTANVALGRNGHIINSPVSQASTMVYFPMNHVIQLPRNGFPLESTAGVMPSLMNFARGNPKSGSHSVAFEMSRHSNFIQGNLDFSPSVLGHQGFTYSEKNGQNKNESTVCKAMVSLRERNEHENPENIAQCYNNLLIDNVFRVNAESLPDLSSDTVLFAEHFGSDALMTTLFKQVSFLSLSSLQLFLRNPYR
ncbi:hypothetical protein HHK36_012333 [Tetracentron sinense]|uniref:Response regulatory domain-containing protein n=1 Tax=Tetracentron sinense TaxID=13715 RepID=A0A834Z941_TETSI|nr:hypothetical protein HHK36_012333 [Tetracentron sinense]